MWSYWYHGVHIWRQRPKTAFWPSHEKKSLNDLNHNLQMPSVVDHRKTIHTRINTISQIKKNTPFSEAFQLRFYLFIYLARLYHKMYCFLEKEHLQIHQIWQILKKHSFFKTKSSDDVLSALDLPFLLQWNFYETYFPTWGLKFVPFG